MNKLKKMVEEETMNKKWLKYASVVLKEVYEMIEDAKTGYEIDKQAAEFAAQFLEKLAIYDKQLLPNLDLHPNGNVIVFFRNKQSCLTLVFSGQGEASWAVCFNKEEAHNDAGYFLVASGIPDVVLEYIDKCAWG